MLFAAKNKEEGEAPPCFSSPPARPWQRHNTLMGRGGSHVLVGVLAEDVLDDHDGFLDHVVDLGLDEIEQRAHAALGRLLCGKRRVWARPCTHFQQTL